MATAAPRFEVTSLGETMLRLSVPEGKRLEEMSNLSVAAGGAESNVCGALAGLGRRCGWLSRLPDDPLGRAALRQIRAAGVDVGSVVLASGERMGTYYVEFSSPPRPIQVYYDRRDSAASGMSVGDIDWDYLLDTRVLHLTGITPALNGSCRELVHEAVRRARSKGVTVSFDVNYRARLWSSSEAASCLRDLIRDVDILICGKADAQRLFGLEGSDRQILDGLQSLSGAAWTVLTLSEAGAVALDGSGSHQQQGFATTVVDKLGAGDAFAAGVIDGWLDGSLAEGLRRGSALAGLILTQFGDMLVSNREELETVLASSSRQIVR